MIPITRNGWDKLAKDEKCSFGTSGEELSIISSKKELRILFGGVKNIDLENLAQQANAPLSVIYNTAQILEKSGRAENLRQRLVQRASDLPAPIRHLVCKKLECPQKQGKVQKTWHLPTNFAHWQKNDDVRLYDLYEEIYQHPDANVLLLGGKVKMVVLKNPGVTIDDLPAYCEQPLRTRRVVNGTLLSCQEWAALVVDDVVEEVWIAKKQSTVN